VALTFVLAIKLLLLLLAANGSPVLAKWLLRDKWAYPLDGGLRFADGRPLLGHSKTIRGVLTGTLATAALAPLLGISWTTGALLGLASLAGDAFSSFIKRRCKIPPSGRALGVDQIPEALLPLWLFRNALGLDPVSLLVLVCLFTVGGLALSRVMFRLGVRDRPY
jgi:CDP-2,3-bis-(O-geranylgeranyl)-sn-glycerol synthase